MSGLKLVAGDVWLRTLTIFGGVSNIALMGYQSIIVVFLVREVGVSRRHRRRADSDRQQRRRRRRLPGPPHRRRRSVLPAQPCSSSSVLPTLALLIPLTSKGPGLALYTIGAFCIGVGVVGGNTIKATFHQSYCPPELRGRLAAQYVVRQLRHDPARRLARRRTRRSTRTPYCAVDHHCRRTAGRSGPALLAHPASPRPPDSPGQRQYRRLRPIPAAPGST